MILSVCFIFIPPVSSNAQAETGQTSTISSLIKEALDSNTEILSAKKAFESASARIPQAGSMNDPMIEFEYDRITADRMLTGDPMKALSVSQDIPFPAKRYLRAKIASKVRRWPTKNYQAKERDVIARLKNGYSELSLVHRSIAINNENKRCFRATVQNCDHTLWGGSRHAGRCDQAQVELAKVDNELILNEQKRVTAQAKLNALLDRDPKSDFEIPSVEPPLNSAAHWMIYAGWLSSIIRN